MDDLLTAADTEENCNVSTGDLLTALETLGYRASAKKVQICQTKVTYLECILKGGQCWLSEACKETVLKMPTSTYSRDVREFLGSAGFC